MQPLRDIAVVVANGIGQMAIVAILFGVLHRKVSPGWRRDLVAGSLFAVAGLFAMANPAEIVPGVLVDLRCVIVGLAAAFVGWPAALVAGLATGAYRISLGGAYEAGCAAIAVAAVMGLTWRRAMGAGRHTATRHLLLLGALISLQVLVLAALPQTWAAATLVPLVLTLSAASVLGALAFGKMIERETMMLAQERMLLDVAFQDPLTGLLNRRGFEREFGGIRALEPDRPMAVLMIDVDFFKQVNDTLGHAGGDEVLRRIAAALRQALRNQDRVARHGGEEFAVLLPDTTGLKALDLAERLRRLVARPGVAQLPVTISLGLAACHDGRTPLEQLLAMADRALYRAKANGRNRVECDQGAVLPASAVIALPAPRRASASAR